MNEKKIVLNSSRGYGYNYASLADFAKQGVTIPKMRTALIDGIEFIQYLDDAGEWQTGARVVIPSDNARMNAAQQYGSAVTYARRFTTALALGIATDDDNVIEKQAQRPPQQMRAVPPQQAQRPPQQMR